MLWRHERNVNNFSGFSAHNHVRQKCSGGLAINAIDPEPYTVIGFRALETLGSKSADRSVNFYLN